MLSIIYFYCLKILIYMCIEQLLKGISIYNKEYIAKSGSIVLIYFLCLFIYDYLGIMDLFGQNFVRRLINMYRRLDPLVYGSKLKPFCKPVKKILSKEDVEKLKSIKIHSKKDIAIFTRKNTTTYQCCQNYSENEIKIINEINQKVREIYEKEIGKKLYDINKPAIYAYKGGDAQHLWHVDPLNLSEIYNIVICFNKKGTISPLQCKDKDENVTTINFEEGDGAFFNGGTTVHQVPPSGDDNSERTVISLAYTTNKELSKKDNRNMCVYLEGGGNYFNILKLILSIFLINFVASKISGVEKLDNSFLLYFIIGVLIIATYVPIYFKTGLGSGRSSSFIYNFVILVLILISTLSLKGGVMFFCYFILSDVFFPSSWVPYD